MLAHRSLRARFYSPRTWSLLRYGGPQDEWHARRCFLAQLISLTAPFEQVARRALRVAFVATAPLRSRPATIHLVDPI